MARSRVAVLAFAALVPACSGARSCLSEEGRTLPYERSPRCDLEAFATSAEKPFWLAVSREHAYWQLRDGLVLRYPEHGGAPVRLAIGEGAHDVHADETTLYWLLDGRLVGAPLPDLREPRVLAEIPGGIASICALDAAHVYVRAPDPAGGDNAHAILQVPKVGGAARKLAETTFERCAVDASHVYFPRRTPAGEIGRVPVAGGEVETVVREVGPVVRMAVADGWMYFASEWSAGDGAASPLANSGGLRRVPVGGGAVEKLAVTGVDAVAFAGGAAWTLDFEGGQYSGTLHLRRHDGPAARDVAICDASAGGWHAMAVGAEHVWFAGGGVLRRVPLGAQ